MAASIVTYALFLNFPVWVPRNLPQMPIRVFKITGVATPEGVVCLLYDHRARVSGLLHHYIHFFF